MTQFQQPPAAPQGQANLEPHRGTMILVFGILGFVVCGIFAILAWAMGSGDLKKMDAGLMDPSGRQLTQVGKILGMVACILAIVGIALWLVMVVFAGAFAVSAS